MAALEFISIELSELKPLITLAFQEDPELLSKFSLLNNPTLEESVDKNFETIAEGFQSEVYQKGTDIFIYRLEWVDGSQRDIIGFTVTAVNDDIPHELFSFGINIKFRTRKIVMRWLQEVRKMMGKFYYVALHKNNTRAIDFFKRNGFTAVTNKGDEQTVRLFSNFQELIRLKQKAEVVYGS